MTRSEFIKEFAQILDVSPTDLIPETELANFENWDSVAYLAALVLVDEGLGKTIRPEVISSAKTFGDILKAANLMFQP